MARAWITDYVDNPSIEREILGDELASEPGDEIEVLLVWHEDVGASYLDRFPRLKGIVRYGVGYENIDLSHAHSRGIVVCNTPDYGTDEVSDSALAFILGRLPTRSRRETTPSPVGKLPISPRYTWRPNSRTNALGGTGTRPES